MYKIIDLSKKQEKYVIDALNNLSEKYSEEGNFEDIEDVNNLKTYIRESKKFYGTILKVQNSNLRYELLVLCSNIASATQRLEKKRKELDKFIGTSKKGYCQGMSDGINTSLRFFDYMIKAAPIFLKELETKFDVYNK